ncbi:glycosyltransferase [Patescibacteria group bacterium]|nr:glycosyltransferase [Patescibacteria group bacterium]
MKILLATGLYAPEIGGPATHTAILEREMPERGIFVHTVPFSSVRKYPKIVRHLLYMVFLFKKVRGVDIVYALDPVSVGVPAYIVALIARKKFILRVPGDYAWEQAVGRYGATDTLDDFSKNIRSQPPMVRVLWFLQGFVARRADAVVVPSLYMKKIVSLWRVSEARLSVVYTAFSPAENSFNKNELRSELGYTGFVVVSIGRLVPWKGFRALIDAIERASKTIAHIQCFIIGDGPEKEMLASYIQEKGLHEYVKILPPQLKNDLAGSISGADVFVLNTGYEGFSHQLLEVMSLRVPIITTPVGGNVELITDQKEGLLITHNDAGAIAEAIKKVASENELAVSLTLAAWDRVQSFSSFRMVEGICVVFNEVVKK